MPMIGIIALFITLGSIYLSYRISDEVFRAAMGLTAVLFGIATLVCAPWILKMVVIAIPFVLGLNRWSAENFN